MLIRRHRTQTQYIEGICFLSRHAEKQPKSGTRGQTLQIKNETLLLSSVYVSSVLCPIMTLSAVPQTPLTHSELTEISAQLSSAQGRNPEGSMWPHSAWLSVVVDLFAGGRADSSLVW